MHALRDELQERLTQRWSDGLLLVPADEADARRFKRFVATGMVTMPFDNMFVLKKDWDQLKWKARARAILLTYAEIHPDTVFCSHSAAVLQDLWTPKFKVERGVHVIAGNSRASKGVIRWHIDGAETDRVEGARLTTIQRTFYDCARDLDFRNGLAIADSYLRATGLSSIEAMEKMVRSFSRRRGVAKAKRALLHADARSENGGESYARAVMIENDVLLPDLQVEVPNPLKANSSYRMDYGWYIEDVLVAGGELDGFEKMEDAEMLRGRTTNQMLRDERIRESLITSLGIPILRFTFDMARRTAPLLAMIDAFNIPRLR